MNTPTHGLLVMALLSKNKLAATGDAASARLRNWALFIGALIPDIVVFIWAPYQNLVNGESMRRIWRELYFEAPMQLMIAPFNSAPIFALLAMIGYWLRKTAWGLGLLMLSLAALIHIATDFPLHTQDAYRHFWPLSDWRFYSPLSYWQKSHHGDWVSLIESLIAAACIVILWRRFPALWVKVILSLSALYYLWLQYRMWLAPHGLPA